MSRALRYAPPLANRGLIVRPRLLAPLRTRFDRRLTAVVAPPGFGKTTLLAQAVAENSLSPLGEDRWLTCQRDDTALSFLAAGTFAAVGLDQPVPDDPHAAAVAAAQAVWSAAPRHIALVLDDAHQIAPGSPGGRFLSELVEELPRNGHLVVASRPPLPLSMARLVATGEAVVLDEEALQFRDDELQTFADSRGVPAELLSEVGGWPALAELTATTGPHAVTGYVWEELLSSLSPDRRHALAVLVAVGGADQEIAAALLGPEVDLGRLLDGLPLVVRARSGWRSLHALWGLALQHHLDAGEVAEARRTAAAVLRRRRQYHDAMDLLLDARAWDEVRSLIVDICEVFTPLVPPDVLGDWLRQLPPDVQQTSEGLLLAAMVVEPSNPTAAGRLLEQALAAPGDPPRVRYACVNALLLLAFWRADRGQMKLLVERLEHLRVDGHAKAATLIALIQALLAADPAQVRAELAVPELISGAPLSPVQDWLHAHLVLLKLGDPVAAEPLARRSLAHAMPTLQAVSRSEILESYRLRGQLEEAALLLPDLLADLTPSTTLCSPELLASVVTLLDALGRHDEAAGLIHKLEPTVAASPVAWAPIAKGLAEAFHLVSLAREEEATATLRSLLHLGVVRSQAVVQVSPSALPLLYVLVPDVRARWDADPPPGCFGEVHRMAAALVAIRERGSLATIPSLPPTTARVARAQFPGPWAAELALALVTVGREEGRELIGALGQPARSVLRARSASSAPEVADTARQLLRELPAVPAHRLRLRVLGPLRLWRDGVVVNAPELRRERVRQLLAYLLVHERPARSAICADLWPDLDEAAASRNLRVTLTYLQNALEPDRGDLDRPYFVRTAGASLCLVVDGPLEVDAQEFERHVDEGNALERQGVPSAALEAYRRATALWGGVYLVDVPDDGWLQWERDRLRDRFVTTAVRAGHLLLARGDSAEARVMAERALRADGWCESAHQLLIAVHLATGDLVSARRVLGHCQQVLRELRVTASQQTLVLARKLQVGR
jgi:DNA-binding SARP family transcriptional activator